MLCKITSLPQALRGNGNGEQGVDAIGECVSLLAGVGGAGFVEGRFNKVIRSYAQWGKSPNDRAPSIFDQSRLYNMPAEQIVDAAMVAGADLI